MLAVETHQADIDVSRDLQFVDQFFGHRSDHLVAVLLRAGALDLGIHRTGRVEDEQDIGPYLLVGGQVTGNIDLDIVRQNGVGG
ncbi:hypothetical protein D3C77_669960 [compost metagenome]